MSGENFQVLANAPFVEGDTEREPALAKMIPGIHTGRELLQGDLGGGDIVPAGGAGEGVDADPANLLPGGGRVLARRPRAAHPGSARRRRWR
jgi:hypothetical protein